MTAMEGSTRMTWLPAAAILLGTGWGANQFTPMLLVYHGSLGLGTGMLEAIFGLYALGLIPGLLLAGPLSDARGRRSVIFPAAVLSLAASFALAAGDITSFCCPSGASWQEWRAVPSSRPAPPGCASSRARPWARPATTRRRDVPESP